MDYPEKMLFEFARKLNNYREFESNEDIYNLIDEFLTEYKLYDQPKRSKREDQINPHALDFSNFLKEAMQKEIDDGFGALNTGKK
jgi:hypothetical protein